MIYGKCGECLFMAGDINRQSGEPQYACRRFPPQLFLIPATVGASGALGTAWPVVKRDQECGEFKKARKVRAPRKRRAKEKRK
jgi:hypothetical protein